MKGGVIAGKKTLPIQQQQQVLMTAAQNPRSLVNLLDKNAKQRADGPRQRTHDPAALSKQSGFI